MFRATALTLLSVAISAAWFPSSWAKDHSQPTEQNAVYAIGAKHLHFVGAEGPRYTQGNVHKHHRHLVKNVHVSGEGRLRHAGKAVGKRMPALAGSKNLTIEYGDWVPPGSQKRTTEAIRVWDGDPYPDSLNRLSKPDLTVSLVHLAPGVDPGIWRLRDERSQNRGCIETKPLERTLGRRHLLSLAISLSTYPSRMRHILSALLPQDSAHALEELRLAWQTARRHDVAPSPGKVRPGSPVSFMEALARARIPKETLAELSTVLFETLLDMLDQTDRRHLADTLERVHAAVRKRNWKNNFNSSCGAVFRCLDRIRSLHDRYGGGQLQIELRAIEQRYPPVAYQYALELWDRLNGVKQQHHLPPGVEDLVSQLSRYGWLDADTVTNEICSLARVDLTDEIIAKTLLNQLTRTNQPFFDKSHQQHVLERGGLSQLLNKTWVWTLAHDLEAQGYLVSAGAVARMLTRRGEPSRMRDIVDVFRERHQHGDMVQRAITKNRDPAETALIVDAAVAAGAQKSTIAALLGSELTLDDIVVTQGGRRRAELQRPLRGKRGQVVAYLERKKQAKQQEPVDIDSGSLVAQAVRQLSQTGLLDESKTLRALADAAPRQEAAAIAIILGRLEPIRVDGDEQPWLQPSGIIKISGAVTLERFASRVGLLPDLRRLRTRDGSPANAGFVAAALTSHHGDNETLRRLLNRGFANDRALRVLTRELGSNQTEAELEGLAADVDRLELGAKCHAVLVAHPKHRALLLRLIEQVPNLTLRRTLGIAGARGQLTVEQLIALVGEQPLLSGLATQRALTDLIRDRLPAAEKRRAAALLLGMVPSESPSCDSEACAAETPHRPMKPESRALLRQLAALDSRVRALLVNLLLEKKTATATLRMALLAVNAAHKPTRGPTPAPTGRNFVHSIEADRLVPREVVGGARYGPQTAHKYPNAIVKNVWTDSDGRPMHNWGIVPRLPKGLGNHRELAVEYREVTDRATGERRSRIVRVWTGDPYPRNNDLRYPDPHVVLVHVAPGVEPGPWRVKTRNLTALARLDTRALESRLRQYGLRDLAVSLAEYPEYLAQIVNELKPAADQPFAVEGLRELGEAWHHIARSGFETGAVPGDPIRFLEDVSRLQLAEDEVLSERARLACARAFVDLGRRYLSRGDHSKRLKRLYQAANSELGNHASQTIRAIISCAQQMIALRSPPHTLPMPEVFEQLRRARYSDTVIRMAEQLEGVRDNGGPFVPSMPARVHEIIDTLAKGRWFDTERTYADIQQLPPTLRTERKLTKMLLQHMRQGREMIFDRKRWDRILRFDVLRSLTRKAPVWLHLHHLSQTPEPYLLSRSVLSDILLRDASAEHLTGVLDAFAERGMDGPIVGHGLKSGRKPDALRKVLGLLIDDRALTEIAAGELVDSDLTLDEMQGVTAEQCPDRRTACRYVDAALAQRASGTGGVDGSSTRLEELVGRLAREGLLTNPEAVLDEMHESDSEGKRVYLALRHIEPGVATEAGRSSQGWISAHGDSKHLSADTVLGKVELLAYLKKLERDTGTLLSAKTRRAVVHSHQSPQALQQVFDRYYGTTPTVVMEQIVRAELEGTQIDATLALGRRYGLSARCISSMLSKPWQTAYIAEQLARIDSRRRSILIQKFVTQKLQLADLVEIMNGRPEDAWSDGRAVTVLLRDGAPDRHKKELVETLLLLAKQPPSDEEQPEVTESRNAARYAATASIRSQLGELSEWRRDHLVSHLLSRIVPETVVTEITQALKRSSVP